MPARVRNIDARRKDLQGANASATATITAQNQWTSGVVVRGIFNISIYGAAAWVATITVQRSFDNATWLEIGSDALFTANEQTTGDEPESGVYWRIGCKTGNFTSGSIAVRISQ